VRWGVLSAGDRTPDRTPRLVIPDLPGLAESEPIARLDAPTFADWFAALLQETCQEPPTLIAHSLNGSLAARFAAARSDLLRRLMIYAAPGMGPYHAPLGLRDAVRAAPDRPQRGAVRPLRLLRSRPGSPPGTRRV
jgi:pimeloyl-ACP methyl ester carboxylesterase